MFKFEKVESKSTVVSKMYDQMKRSILRGDLKAGSRITEMNLTKAFGVSRTPVREVISRLIAKGFIEEQGNLKVVVDIRVSLREIIGIRATLEGYAARLAAKNATPEELDLIAATSSGKTHLNDSVPLAERELGNDSFHSAIAAAAHNRLLTKMISDFYEYVLTDDLIGFYSEPDAVEHALQHQTILNALKAQDPEAAEEAMNIHVMAVGEVIQSAIERLQSSEERRK